MVIEMKNEKKKSISFLKIGILPIFTAFFEFTIVKNEKLQSENYFGNFRSLGTYSQQSIFFLTYKWAQ
jgi:hypothetical protein